MSWLSVCLTGLYCAFGYSVAGLRSAWRDDRPFRQEVVVLIAAVAAALWLGESGTERALLIGSWLLVIVVELINSAIESTVNRIGLERHELSGRAKDLASASVFCSIVLAVIVWLAVLTG